MAGLSVRRARILLALLCLAAFLSLFRLGSLSHEKTSVRSICMSFYVSKFIFSPSATLPYGQQYPRRAAWLEDLREDAEELEAASQRHAAAANKLNGAKSFTTTTAPARGVGTAGDRQPGQASGRADSQLPAPAGGGGSVVEGRGGEVGGGSATNEVAGGTLGKVVGGDGTILRHLQAAATI